MDARIRTQLILDLTPADLEAVLKAKNATDLGDKVLTSVAMFEANDVKMVRLIFESVESIKPVNF